MRAASENAGHCACVLLVVVITIAGAGLRGAGEPRDWPARNPERTGDVSAAYTSATAAIFQFEATWHKREDLGIMCTVNVAGTYTLCIFQSRRVTVHYYNIIGSCVKSGEFLSLVYSYITKLVKGLVEWLYIYHMGSNFIFLSPVYLEVTTSFYVAMFQNGLCAAYVLMS